MEPSEIVRFIKGLLKKHGKEFAVTLRYQTAAQGKIRKRHGEFVDLNDREGMIGDVID
jgi:hypothetical protein